jgi:hypothetical protein
MHTVKEADMIAAKLDPLIKKLGEGSQQQIQAPIYAMGSHFTCEVCGNDGTQGTTTPRPEKTAHTLTTTTGIVHHKEARGGTSHVHHFREVTTITPISI